MKDIEICQIMIKMNYLVEVEGKSAKEVALEYLKYNNLLDNK